MNKRRKAAALKYESTYEAPVVTAAGAGQIAEKIIDKAKESDVPIVENKELTELLTKVDVGDNVPAELYDAVASVLAYVLQIDSLIE